MKKSYVIAGGVAAVVMLWVASGVLVGSENPPEREARGTSDVESAETRMSVEFRTSRAERMVRSISVPGHVEPNRTVTLRAETAGPVTEILAKKGIHVSAGDVLLRLASEDRQERLAQAEARVEERSATYEATKQLRERGHQSQRSLDEAFSALQEARAELAAIRLEIGNLEIRAPFDGILEERKVEVGDFVSVGTEVATIVDNSPIVVVVQVAQQDIGRIDVGGEAKVVFGTGGEAQGRIRYVGSRASAETRTFRVEIEVANPENRFRSGITAEAEIPTGEVMAHFFSPSILGLDDQGVLGVKTIDAQDRVAFHPVTIVQAEARGIWVDGLPDTVRLITVGQGFAQVGEKVRAVPAANENQGARQ